MKWHRLVSGVLMLAVLLVATVALAAGGGGHGNAHHLNWWTWDQQAPPIGWFIIDFIIFVGLLYFLTKDKVVAMFKNRHETVKSAIEEAQAEHRKAQAHRDEYRTKIARVKEEAEELISGATIDGEQERERIITQAKQYAERLQKDTSVAVEQEVRSARHRLHDQEVSEVLRRANEMLRQNVGKAEQERLLEQAIVELESGKLSGIARQTDGGAP